MTTTLTRPLAPTRSLTWRTWYLLGTAAITAYGCGIGWQAQFVSYPLFGEVSAAEFPAYHLAYNDAIPGVVIVPGFLSFLACIGFFWARPTGTSRVAAAVVAVAGLGSVLSTVLWAIPMHDRLDQIGQDAATLQSLLTANAVRTGFLTLATGALFSVVASAVRRRVG